MKKNVILRKLAVLGLTSALMFSVLTGCGAGTEGVATRQNVTATEDKAATDENKETSADETNTDSAAAADTSTEEPAASGELIPFRVGCGDASSNHLGDLASIAQDKGFLEEELNKVGFTLEAIGFQGAGPEVNAAILSGSLDAGSYAEFPAITNKAVGADTTVVAIANPKQLYGILVASDEIQSVKDLEGKRIVVAQGTTLQYGWDSIVRETGIDAGKIEIINANVMDGTSLLQTGDADALISTKISVELFALSGLGHLLEDVPEDVYGQILLTVDNGLLKEHPEVAVAYNKALIRASEYAQNDPEGVFSILGAAYGEAGALVYANGYTVDGSLSYLTPEINDSNLSSIKNVYEWLNTNGLLASEIDIDSLVDSQYYEQAAAELGK
ncbi:MAG: ABC transporter substrate-binding protein [Lachnospiraceae bacterium]|nr:ABC transporter substrate-binding protein [Lachnospiraceae bacterium]